MARSNSRLPVAAFLSVFGYLLTAQLRAFVNPALQGRDASRHLRSRVSLAATAADVDAAEKDFKLKKWAAGQLAGSAQEAAAVARAQQAEATYAALKAELEGAPAAMPAMPTPVAAAPAVAPVAAAPVAAVPSTVSKADLSAAKQAAQLLTWSANKLMSEGAPQAAAMKAKADQAVAAFEALKQAEASGAAAPAPVAAAPVAVPVAAAPVAAASVSKQDLTAAKQNAQLLTWSANKLMSEGAPQAAAMKAKADQAVAAFEALKQAQATGVAMPAAPAASMPAPAVAAPAPVAAAPVAVSPSGPSSQEVLKAKKEMELHAWAAEKLASTGSLQAAVMQAKAEQSRQAYEALRAMQETQMVSR